ncbi:DUF4239 domain-containing protein [Pseudorhodoplanes sp.]|uniref:bestrophin-like domain n=1 Tax=Pseudorhodoplanes sp. TaxID=1934341 RepID=UPI002CB79BB2|nr:DUF4239 domain-containing protein [Pseudorhodoplanes sp.]HWV41969.1 DUF4239 domain-containing protein [Pseudorhodoplanes sp.]
MRHMPILDWLHDLPFILGLGVVCAAFVVPTLVGSYLLQPKVAQLLRGERDANTVLGFLLNAFALYFGVLLALLSIAVFENHNKAEDAVVREAAAIIKLYRDINSYPADSRPDLIGIMDRYVDEVTGPGWKIQAEGKANPKEIVMLTELHRAIGAFEPKDMARSVRYAETLRVLDDFVEARRLRISAGTSSIPRIMWFVVLVGAVMNVIVIWMFDLRPLTHAIIGGTLSLFIGLVIYMVAVLDAPFKGTYGIKPDAIAMVHQQSGMHRTK